MRVYERAVAVDGADAIAVSIGAKPGIVFARKDRLARIFDVGFDGLGMNAAEAWVALAADFGAGNSVSLEEFAEEARGCAVHRVRHEAKLCFAQAWPIHQLFDGVQIGGSCFEGLN